jgi:hypothetical protein
VAVGLPKVSTPFLTYQASVPGLAGNVPVAPTAAPFPLPGEGIVLGMAEAKFRDRSQLGLPMGREDES